MNSIDFDFETSLKIRTDSPTGSIWFSNFTKLLSTCFAMLTISILRPLPDPNVTSLC